MNGCTGPAVPCEGAQYSISLFLVQDEHEDSIVPLVMVLREQLL